MVRRDGEKGCVSHLITYHLIAPSHSLQYHMFQILTGGHGSIAALGTGRGKLNNSGFEVRSNLGVAVQGDEDPAEGACQALVGVFEHLTSG